METSPAPRLFRVLIPAKALEQSRRFYETLLATPGRVVAGGRIYFDCGPVLLGILDYSTLPAAEFSGPTESLYFATEDLEAVHRRARNLDCLAPGLLHDDPESPLGKIVMRPWGKRSFYATDPSGNSLCFVDHETLFTGSPRQVEELHRAAGVPPPISTTPLPRRSRAKTSSRRPRRTRVKRKARRR